MRRISPLRTASLLGMAAFLWGLSVAPTPAEAVGVPELTIPERKYGNWKADQAFRERVNGRILLQVERSGQAWYVYPEDGLRYYLGRPDDAFRIMRETGLGITNENLARIPEQGTDWSIAEDLNRLRGRIVLQVEEHGEAWYIHPVDGKRHYLGRPSDAFRVMRETGLGASDHDVFDIPANTLMYLASREFKNYHARQTNTSIGDLFFIKNHGTIPQSTENFFFSVRYDGNYGGEDKPKDFSLDMGKTLLDPGEVAIVGIFQEDYRPDLDIQEIAGKDLLSGFRSNYQPYYSVAWFGEVGGTYANVSRAHAY